MTTTEQRTTLDAVRALVPDIKARVDEIEQARTLPRDLVDDLVAAGCFRALVPRRYGGDELPWADALAIIEELARADGSVGWTVMIGAAAPALLGHLPATTFDAVVRLRARCDRRRDVQPVGRCDARRRWVPRRAGSGRSPVDVAMPTGSSPTAWSTTGGCRRCG